MNYLPNFFVNAVEINCCKCNKKMLISTDELNLFGKGICDDCDTRSRKFIRHKVVYDWNNMTDYQKLIAEAIVDKEFIVDNNLNN